MIGEQVNGRDRALLRAVAAGRCDLGGGPEPVLLIDGLGCADSVAAHRLLAAGLIASADPRCGLAAALLTDAGRAALNAA
ncbi:MAG: hypothetical protein ACT4RN_03300 [Pseudonocardia sp.]